MSSAEPIIQAFPKRQAPHADVEARKKRSRYGYDADGSGANCVLPLTPSSESWPQFGDRLSQPSENSSGSSTSTRYGINEDIKVQESAQEDERPESPTMDWSPSSFREPAACTEICFGALCDAKIQLYRAPVFEPQHGTSQNVAFRQFSVTCTEAGWYALTEGDEPREPFAQLDHVTCELLKALRVIDQVCLVGVVEEVALMQSKTKPKSKRIIPVSINVYGPFHAADRVALALSGRGRSAYLQLPYFLEDGCRHINPQHLHPAQGPEDLTHLAGLTKVDLSAKAISNEVENVFESLSFFGSDSSSLSLSVPSAVTTSLKSHQLAAMSFILRREIHEGCQKALGDLMDIVRMPPRHRNSSYFRGGILADAMGLGKTLSILASVVADLENAGKFASAESHSPQTRATLIVVTSMQVLDVWIAELMRHIKGGVVKTLIFHGHARPGTYEGVADNDIVLTTYAVLAKDWLNQGVLHKLEWYRVVLDEAHWIRNTGTNHFRAARDLRAMRRWCVTGTPIQNRLEDVLSLLKFLHMEPFAQPSVFQHYILEPLGQDTPQSTPLRALLATICLRRGTKLLGIPEPTFESVNLDLQPDEQSQYKDILKKCARAIDDVVSNKKTKTKSYNILFTAIIRLRRVCNHGTLALGMPGIRAASPAANADGDQSQDCEMCFSGYEDMMDLVREEQFCLQCGSIVFSYWTATLDFLEVYLNSRGIRFLRIDGRVTYNARVAILESFRVSDTPILLMSIQTGAVGLNLTAANYVHIVEPQWNPAVEDQAIARAVRMGQTRAVTVFRYVVRNSVEENILNLQKRKSNLAKFTLDSGPGDGANSSVEDLKFVLHLDSGSLLA